MKRLTKRFIFPLLVMMALSILPSCNEDGVLDLVIITGVDMRLCPCCGGFMINFNENGEPYEDVFKLAYELPEESGIDFESEFPIKAWINWEPAGTPCDVIEVSFFEGILRE